MHIKVETGMGGVGGSLKKRPPLVHHLRRLTHVELEGVFSHYANAEVIDSPEGEAQEKKFEEALRAVRDAGFNPAYIHMANSAGFIHMKSLHFPIGRTMVRPGIAL